MCFRNEDLLLWINLDGYEQKLMLRLCSVEGREYNDYVTIERVLPAGQGAEVLYTVPFKEIADIVCDTSGDGDCTISFDTDVGDGVLRRVRVARHCYSYFTVRKLLNAFKKSKKKA